MRHFPFNLGDWAAATAHLSDVEECIYLRLTLAYYSREAPIPDVKSALRLARAQTGAARNAVAVVLDEFFYRGDDGQFHHRRCDAEIERYREKAAKASRSAGVRWSAGDANAMRTHMRTHSEGISVGNANQEPRTKNHREGHSEPPTKGAPERSAPRDVSKAKPAAKKTPMPAGFAISDRVREWAEDKGHGRLDEHFEHFVGVAKAKGYTYADWDQALMNAIRDDWAKIAGRATPGNGAARSERERVAAQMFGHGGSDDDAIDSTATRVD